MGRNAAVSDEANDVGRAFARHPIPHQEAVAVSEGETLSAWIMDLHDQ
jgi:hypothetical protein